MENQTQDNKGPATSNTPNPRSKVPIPSSGRIVHYYTRIGRVDVYPLEPFPAIVMPRVEGPGEDGLIDLNVFYRGGTRFHASVPYSETPVQDHWSWPPKQA